MENNMSDLGFSKIILSIILIFYSLILLVIEALLMLVSKHMQTDIHEL